MGYQSPAKTEPIAPLSIRGFGLAAPEPGKDFYPEIDFGDASPFLSTHSFGPAENSA